MKKIVASVGLVALGASGVNAVHGQDMTTPPPAKPWNVSASLRGFYDDNVTTAPNGTPKTSTFGFEVSPAAGLNWSSGATTAKLSYQYSFLYYDKKPINYGKHYDQDHTFTGELTHAFSERYQVAVDDSFVVGQEPDALRHGVLASNERISGENKRNYGRVVFDATLTPELGVQAGYDNAWYDYVDTFTIAKNVTLGGTVLPSNAGALNRIENGAHVDLRWTMTPETVPFIGYRFQNVAYTKDEVVAGDYPPDATSYYSWMRNSLSHMGYLGVDHTFLPDLIGHLEAGFQYIDFYNDPLRTTDFSPYVQGVLTYTYAPQSNVQLGFTEMRAPIDITGSSRTDNVRDAQASLLYASINHQIAPNLIGSIIGTFQNNILNGSGSFNNKTEQYYEVGLNLKYQFNPFLAGEVGYNYDRTDSDIAFRAYDRNRVYLGITANY